MAKSKPKSTLKKDSKSNLKKKECGSKKGSLAGDEDYNDHVQWSKSKKKRMRLIKSKQKQSTLSTETKKPKTEISDGKVTGSNTSIQDNTETKSIPKETNERRNNSTPTKKGERTKTAASALQTKFQQRLSGSRFRVLNEELYTSSSTSAFRRFQENPILFDEYHQGFRKQVKQWPINPISLVLQKIRKRCKSGLVVADFGCGDAELAHSLLQESSKVVTHSLDLVARGPHANLITPCDIASTPLKSKSIDIGVFCLSLMGTNLADFIREAHRVLKKDGTLYVIEVRSRFESTNKNLNAFTKILEQLGFSCSSLDRSSNTMFVFLELTKNDTAPSKTLAFTAKPCVYKRR